MASPFITPLRPEYARTAPGWQMPEPAWPAPSRRDMLEREPWAPVAYASSLADVAGGSDLGAWAAELMDADLMGINEQAAGEGMPRIGDQGDIPWWMSAGLAAESLGVLDPHTRQAGEVGPIGGSLRSLHGMPEVQSVPTYTGDIDIGADPGLTRRLPHFQRLPLTGLMAEPRQQRTTAAGFLGELLTPNLQAAAEGSGDAAAPWLGAGEAASFVGALPRRIGGALLRPVQRAAEDLQALGASVLPQVGDQPPWLKDIGPRPMQIFGGSGADTADWGMWRQAKDMEAGGAPPEAVFTETGWWRGQDNEWRFEIPDTDAEFNLEGLAPDAKLLEKSQQAKLARRAQYRVRRKEGEDPEGYPGRLRDWLTKEHPDIDPYERETIIGLADLRTPGELRKENKWLLEQANRTRSGRVGDVLKHPQLYAAYPELADVNMRVEPTLAGTNTAGSYNEAEKRISVNPEYMEPDWLRSMSLHELQHGVQATEDFARGGNVGMFSNPTIDDVTQADERAASVFRARKALEALQRAGIEDTSDPSNLQTVVGVLHQADADTLDDTLPMNAHMNALFGLGGEFPSMQVSEMLQAVDEVELRLRKEAERLNEGLGDPNYAQKEYHRLHGEAEARAVQYRAEPEEAFFKGPYPWKDIGYDLPEGTPLNILKR